MGKGNTDSMSQRFEKILERMILIEIAKINSKSWKELDLEMLAVFETKNMS